MVSEKLTRRQWAATVASTSVVPLTAQETATPDELLKQAREQVRRNAEQLTKREVPMATEPAFQFKA